MPDPRDLLPLRPVVFQVLLVLADGERHGWSLVRELQSRVGGERLLPATFYRLLTSMRREKLIEVAEPSREERLAGHADTGANAERRRYFQLTAYGRDVARAEARRLEQLVRESRVKRLIPARGK